MSIKKSHQRVFALISTTVVMALLSQWLLLPKFQNDVSAAALPEQFDSVSAVNYATILGRATDFGICAYDLHQVQHMQSTYAAAVFSRSGSYSTIDMIPQGYTAQILIDSIDHTRCIPSEPAIQLDGAVPGVFNIEVGTSILENPVRTTGNYEDANIKVQTNSDVVIIPNSGTYNNIDLMISNVFESSAQIQSRINDGYGIDYHDFWDGSVLDLNNPAFDNRVVYIDVDSELLTAIGQSEGLNINKPESTVVVFNITDAAGCNDGDAVKLSKFTVTVDGVTAYSDVSATSVPEETRLNDSMICQKIIWNITSQHNVRIDKSSGLFITPNSPLTQTYGGIGTGWVVAQNFENTGGEWHFIYQGGNQEVSTDGVGQIHFAARKAITDMFNGSQTVENCSIFLEHDIFTFNWYETGSDYDITGLTPTYTTTNQATNTVKFDTLTFRTAILEEYRETVPVDTIVTTYPGESIWGYDSLWTTLASTPNDVTFHVEYMDEEGGHTITLTFFANSNPEETYTYSIEDLYDISIKKCLKIFEEVYKVLYEKQDIDKLKKYIPNISYSTGLELDKNKRMQYFEF